MKHRLYLPTFLPVSFPDAMETFLEDMAKKGWFLKKVGYFLSFCQFEKGTPAPGPLSSGTHSRHCADTFCGNGTILRGIWLEISDAFFPFLFHIRCGKS